MDNKSTGKTTQEGERPAEIDWAAELARHERWLRTIVLARVREVVSVGSPVLIACIGDPQPVYQEMSFEKEDCSAAVENMLLAITALGYATCWVDGVLRSEGRAEKLGEILNVPEGRCVQVVLPVGVPKEKWQQKEKKAFDERAWFNRCGG